MKASKHGKRYKIIYRCPNYGKVITEYFSSEEEATLRIAQIELDRKCGTLKPPTHLLDPDKDRDMLRQCMTVEQLMTEFLTVLQEIAQIEKETRLADSDLLFSFQFIPNMILYKNKKCLGNLRI